jgi:dTDP-4-amino-4,6-dideoxygalactose transaminase
MIKVSALTVQRSDSIRQAMAQMNDAGLGMSVLVDPEGRFDRTVTDGDLRRLLLDGAELSDDLSRLPAIQSWTVTENTSRRQALALMDEKLVNNLPVLDSAGKVVAILDRRDISQQILLSTPHMGQNELSFVEDAFRTNWIAPLGPNVDAFEAELAAKVGISHAAALSSGTAAIHLALRLLKVGPGDRVFCSSLTFAASANPILYQGAEPVFIDSELASWNMSPSALEQALTQARSEGWTPKAVLVVNLYGQSADLDPILEICNRYRVPIIEDAAESLGASYKGKASGTLGLLGIYSFNGNKIITTSGGGMLVSEDEELIAKARFLSTQARDPALHYQHSEIGYNYRMSNILAGVGRGQLQVLEDRVTARREVFESYRTGLAGIDAIQWMPEPNWSYSNRWLSTCTLDPAAAGMSALDLILKLSEEMIEARPVWKPMHLQPVFEHCRYFAHEGQSVSDGIFEAGICLPSGSNMTQSELDRVVSTVTKILARA